MPLDFLTNLLTPDMLVKVGAIYGAVQAVAQVVMLFAKPPTLAFRVAKYIVAGKSRAVTG